MDGLDLRIGKLSLRLTGMVEADAAGQASGAMAIYSKDPDALLQAAAEAGMIPRAALRLGQGMIRNLAALPVAATPEDWNMTFPEPQPGELRLPLSFAGGQVRLGPIPLGPAPMLRR